MILVKCVGKVKDTKKKKIIYNINVPHKINENIIFIENIS